jgi:hypothetical protein
MSHHISLWSELHYAVFNANQTLLHYPAFTLTATALASVSVHLGGSWSRHCSGKFQRSAPLSLAAIHGDADAAVATIIALLKAGASMTARGAIGGQPLHFAAILGRGITT